MATAGQLKTRIDLLKKKIAEKGGALPPERRRGLRKRLKRLQRARRTALRGKPAGAKTGGAAETAAPAPA